MGALVITLRIFMRCLRHYSRHQGLGSKWAWARFAEWVCLGHLRARKESPLAVSFPYAVPRARGHAVIAVTRGCEAAGCHSTFRLAACRKRHLGTCPTGPAGNYVRTLQAVARNATPCMSGWTWQKPAIAPRCWKQDASRNPLSSLGAKPPSS